MYNQLPICVDDFGECVFRCWLTSKIVYASKSQVIGAIVPGVKSRHVIVAGDEGKAAHRQSIRAFQASERNCNTCIFLERVRHEKSPYGFLQGKCTSTDGQPHLSPTASHAMDEIMVFHPEDPMHMPCHEQR